MKIGFAFCGSFCDHPGLLKLYEGIARGRGGRSCAISAKPSPSARRRRW